jgi:hypothetical protein
MDLIIGTTGAFLILVTFLLVQSKKISPDNIFYDLINFLGSLLLVIYAIRGKSYPFIILNTVWALASLKDIFTYFFSKKKIGENS